jgi:3-phenylpropionate/cinnamic acid dioxygenase small subunit
VDQGAVVDELLVGHVLARYCHLVDDGRFDELVELFTADGTFAFGDLAATGRWELRSWFEAMQPPELRGKHLTTNVIVDVDGDEAVAVSDFVFFAFRERRLVPMVAGRYRDELTRVDGGWRIRRRDSEQLRPPG